MGQQQDATAIGDKLFSVSTLRPLGRRGAEDVDSSQAQDSDTFYQLMHPHSITERGGIRLFADVQPGHEVTLMTSSSVDFVDLVTAATDGPDVSAFCESLQGALVVYCAGCSLQVGSEIVNVARTSRQRSEESPSWAHFRMASRASTAQAACATATSCIHSCSLVPRNQSRRARATTVSTAQRFVV